MDEAVANAHTILEKAAEHDRNESLQKLFQRANGVALVTEYEPEVTISGEVGKGLVLVQNNKETSDSQWSLPWACTLGGTGWGLGGAQKQILVFILDQESLNSLTGPLGIELSNGVSLAMGTFGNDTRVGSHFVSESGIGEAFDFLNEDGETTGGLVSIAFAQGTYVPASANGAGIFPDQKINQDFYGKDVTLEDVCLNKVKPPNQDEELKSSLKKLHKKLRNFSKGKNAKVNPEAYEQNGAVNVPNEAPAAIENVVADAMRKLETTAS